MHALCVYYYMHSACSFRPPKARRRFPIILETVGRTGRSSCAGDNHHPRMLPSGFEWRHNGLWVNGTLAALCAEVPDACRVELRVGRIGHRITFQPDLEHGRAYVEAWARRWEAEIRALYYPIKLRQNAIASAPPVASRPPA